MKSLEKNHKNMDISREQVLDIRQKILTQSRIKERNKKLFDKFHKKK